MTSRSEANPQRVGIPMPEMLPDQRAYLQEILARANKYDPDFIIGGPRVLFPKEESDGSSPLNPLSGKGVGIP